MAVTTAVTDAMKRAYLDTIAGHTLKIALYTQAASSLGSGTTAYTTTGEVTGTGYTAGGVTLSGLAVAVASNVAYLDASDASWASSTITADAAMLYDASDSNKCLRVWSFTSASSSNSTFTLTMPGPSSSSALLRIA